MIETLELRIGNAVKCKVSNDAGIYYVRALDGSKRRIMLNGVRDGMWYDESKIKPVKLTEEWLLKFGFDKEEIGGSPLDTWNEWSIDDFIIHSSGTEGKSKDDFVLIIRPGKVIKLEYVHQLQNIYLDIQEETLTIKQ